MVWVWILHGRGLFHEESLGANQRSADGKMEPAGTAMGQENGNEALMARIVRDARICGGEPVFKGTRVTLRTVLASLAAGDSAGDILKDFPALRPEDIQSAIAFAAASAAEDLPVPEAPQIR